jgi:hypothetical protein
MKRRSTPSVPRNSLAPGKLYPPGQPSTTPLRPISFRKQPEVSLEQVAEQTSKEKPTNRQDPVTILSPAHMTTVQSLASLKRVNLSSRKCSNLLGPEITRFPLLFPTSLATSEINNVSQVNKWGRLLQTCSQLKTKSGN